LLDVGEAVVDRAKLFPEGVELDVDLLGEVVEELLGCHQR
jgi:hypothetical protein